MRRFLSGIAILALVGVAVIWTVSAPERIAESDIPSRQGDPVNGRYMFFAAGCNSCHAAPGAKGDAKQVLTGGMPLKSDFGTFYAPNISPDPEHGIGGWTTPEFVNAVMRGISPDGRHYYPAFPYTSYQRMTIDDVVDLKAFIDTLPAGANDAPDHDLPVVLRLRRGIGLWKELYMGRQPPQPDPGADPQVLRGAYLVGGPGHCGECHTPRDALGGLDFDWAFAGAPDPSGKGIVPNITPHEDGIGSWSIDDIAGALKHGILPDFETFGGAMVPVQENIAILTDEDRRAIAAYLKSVPPKPSRHKK